LLYHVAVPLFADELPLSILTAGRNGRLIDHTFALGEALPTLDAVEEAAIAARFPNELRGPVAEQRNHVSNSGAENSALNDMTVYDGGGWTGVTRGRVAGSRPGALDGHGWVYTITRTEGNNRMGIYQSFNIMSITRNVQHHFSAWVKASAGVNVKLLVDWATPSGSTEVASVTATGDWQRVKGVFTLPAGSTGGNIYVYQEFPTVVGQVLLIDDILVSQLDTNYFDGSYPNGSFVGLTHRSNSLRPV
jgi:hypothetical protein